MIKTWITSSGGHAFATVRILPTQAPHSRRVSLGIEASHGARIPSSPAGPPILVLWLSQVTRWFCGEPLQTPRADSGHELLPCTGSSPRLCLAFLANAGRAWFCSATGSTALSLLVSPLLGGLARRRPFATVVHLHERKSSCNLRLQYLAKSQSTPHCQSLNTPVLRRTGPHFLTQALTQKIKT
jgi:hypothetical protein